MVVHSYSDLLKVELAAVGLSYDGPIVAVGEHNSPERVSIRRDLEQLGALQSSGDTSDPVWSLTFAGHEALNGAMDVQSGVMLSAAKALHIEPYALAAQAFITCGVDLFQRMHLAMGIDTPLTEEQRALGGCHGDIVAAVRLYLRWIADELYSAECRILKIQCFKKCIQV